MKRIKESGSTTNLNETTFDSLKPLYGSKGNPPYYDPNDLHSHIWKNGKLGIEDNPKVPTYSKSKMVIRDCIYCKVCHVIKDSFQSTVGNNRDIVDDIITVVVPPNASEYCIIPATSLPIEKIGLKTINYDTNYDNNIPVLQKLFHVPEGIFEDYVIIKEKS